MRALPERFERYLEYLSEGLGHADRHAGLKGYCTGLSCPQVLGPDGMLDNDRGARHGTQERDAGGEAR